MVIVADDIALPDNKQPRGIAGTALVHKIAGYAAEQGKSLSEVRDIARQASESVWSLGLAMETCNLPGSSDEDDRIQRGQVELGLGIHGEPGASTVDSHNSQKLIETLVAPLKAQAGDDRVAVLINNLGGVSALEMALLTKELAHSALKDQIAYLIGPAPLVSSLDMKGFSLSLLRLNETFEKAINADVQTVGWQKPVPFAPMKTQRHNPVYNQLEIEPSENPQVKTLVSTAARTLVDLENRLNALDAKVGDGDTGSTFAEGAREIIHLLEQGAAAE
jgi:dihydroxyacetone kinase